MSDHWGAVAGTLLLGWAAMGAAAAETAELRLMRPIDLAALPLLVMEDEKLKKARQSRERALEKEQDRRGNL